MHCNEMHTVPKDTLRAGAPWGEGRNEQTWKTCGCCLAVLKINAMQFLQTLSLWVGASSWACASSSHPAGIPHVEGCRVDPSPQGLPVRGLHFSTFVLCPPGSLMTLSSWPLWFIQKTQRASHHTHNQILVRKSRQSVNRLYTHAWRNPMPLCERYWSRPRGSCSVWGIHSSYSAVAREQELSRGTTMSAVSILIERLSP